MQPNFGKPSLILLTLLYLIFFPLPPSLLCLLTLQNLKLFGPLNFLCPLQGDFGFGRLLKNHQETPVFSLFALRQIDIILPLKMRWIQDTKSVVTSTCTSAVTLCDYFTWCSHTWKGQVSAAVEDAQDVCPSRTP